MAGNRHSSRRNKLMRAIRKEDADAILVTDEKNVTWLTGFTGDSTWMLLSKSNTVLLSDTRYATQIKNECGDDQLDVEIRDASSTMLKTLTKVLTNAKVKNLAFESDKLTHASYCGLVEAAENTTLVPTSGITENLRAVKDKQEIKDIRLAVELAERGMATLKAGLKPGMTELQIAHNLEHAMRSFGATRAGFHPIVAVGPNAALPHAIPGNATIDESNVLLVDWGAETLGGYRSDLTRVLFTGSVSAKVRAVYEVVLKAQVESIKAIRPGARCCDIDAIARNIIDEEGYGKYFGHGLGHGFGLQIHEQPRLSPISEQLLEPGMVVTVEPGIYLPGRFGVRIEDDILVTRDGCEVLSNVPKQFEDCFVEFLT
ncbi:MAG: M24 family metallopeptidase [Planctomycetaceae bacterium]